MTNLYLGYGFGLFLRFLQIVIIIALIIGWILAVQYLVRVIKMKGHFRNETLKLWFVGICGTPLILGLLAISLPDWSGFQSKLSSMANPTNPTLKDGQIFPPV